MAILRTLPALMVVATFSSGPAPGEGPSSARPPRSDEATLRTALRVRPEDPQVALDLGLLLHRRNRDDREAHGLLEKAAAAFPRRRDVQLACLDSSFAIGDTAAAARVLSRVQPELDADLRFALDTIYVLVGARRFSEAREQWNRLAPRLQESLRAPSPSRAAEAARQRRAAEGLFVQGLLTARLGEPADAVRMLRDADGYGFPPLASPLMLLAADCLFELNELPHAVQAYEEVLKRAPGNVEARLRLGMALYSLRRLDAAEAAIREVLRRSPRQPTAHFHLGAVRFEQKRIAEARVLLEQELAIDPRCSGCMAKLAHVAYLEGDDGQCEAWISRAKALDPEHPETSLVSGMLANRSGRFEDAIRDLSRVVARTPGDAAARYQLVLAYRRSGDAEKARQEQEVYERLIQEQRDRELGVRGPDSD